MSPCCTSRYALLRPIRSTLASCSTVSARGKSSTAVISFLFSNIVHLQQKNNAASSQTAAGSCSIGLTSLHADGGASLHLTRAGRKYHDPPVLLWPYRTCHGSTAALYESLGNCVMAYKAARLPISGTQMNVSEICYSIVGSLS